MSEEELDEVEAAIQRLAQTQQEDLLPEGTVVAGRFEVVRKLGMGAMGAVYLARQKSMDRHVALKTLQPHFLQNEQLLRRFYLEAKAASKLDHPNIVKIYDFGIDEDLRLPFIAMEYLTGEDMGDLLRAHGPFSEREATALLSEVAKALVEAHDKGIVHRDLKPDNIHVRTLIDGDQQCKVLDFGIAKVVEGASESEANMTGTGMAIGTPMYMSPEQICSQPVDFRADLYALGCILYELLAGSAPFGNQEQDRMKVLLAHVNQRTPDLPETLADGLAPTSALIHTLQSLMAKRPDERPGSTSSVARVLKALSRGESCDLNALLSADNASHQAPKNAPLKHTPSEAELLVDVSGQTMAEGSQALLTPAGAEPGGFGSEETAAFQGVAPQGTQSPEPQRPPSHDETADFIPALSSEDEGQTAEVISALTPQGAEPEEPSAPPHMEAEVTSEATSAPQPSATTPASSRPASHSEGAERKPPVIPVVVGVLALVAIALFVFPSGDTPDPKAPTTEASATPVTPKAQEVTKAEVTPPTASAPTSRTTPSSESEAKAVDAKRPLEPPTQPPPTAPTNQAKPSAGTQVKGAAQATDRASRQPVSGKVMPKALKVAPKPPRATQAPAKAKAPKPKAQTSAPEAEGDNAKAKKARIKVGRATVRTGALTRKDARRVMARTRPTLKRCFKSAGLTERVTVRTLVGGGGRVRSFVVKPASATFKSCVKGTIKGLTFPKTPGSGFNTVEVSVSP